MPQRSAWTLGLSLEGSLCEKASPSWRLVRAQEVAAEGDWQMRACLSQAAATVATPRRDGTGCG